MKKHILIGFILFWSIGALILHEAKAISSEIPELIVQHETKGNQVLVECILTGISFRETEDSKQKTGKIVIWVDGLKKSEASTAVFIIRDLSSGNHQVKLDVVDLKNNSYGLKKEFVVNIP